jgi:RNA polymerase-binding transcription factor DksA
MTDYSRHRRQLIRRLDALGVRLRVIDAELGVLADQDWSDQAIEREDDETLERLGRAAGDESRSIRSALARMKDGTYGTCTRCGAPIGEDRLAVLPATPFCRICAREVAS